MFSKSVIYRLRSIICLSRKTDADHLMKLEELIPETGISGPILASVLQKLAKRDIISSKKGRNGGFYMSGPQKDRSIVEIIPEVGRMSILSGGCLLGRDHCHDQSLCPYHELVTKVRGDLGKIFTDRTIGEISDTLYDKSLTNTIE